MPDRLTHGAAGEPHMGMDGRCQEAQSEAQPKDEHFHAKKMDELRCGSSTSLSALKRRNRLVSRLCGSRSQQTLLFVILVFVLLGYLSWSVYMASSEGTNQWIDYAGADKHMSSTDGGTGASTPPAVMVHNDAPSLFVKAPPRQWNLRLNIDAPRRPGQTWLEAMAAALSSTATSKIGSPPTKTAEQPANVSELPLSEDLRICSEGHIDTRVYIQNKPRSAYEDLPKIYFITPTYPRREQTAELTRLANTLLHVPRLHWLVGNDHHKCDKYLDGFFQRVGIPYTHLVSPMPAHFRKLRSTPRGVSNRLAAIKWLNRNNITEGVMYFGDDDNTYDLRLFDEIRTTKYVSMLPVGLFDTLGVVGPVVRHGKVVGFIGSWVGDRAFAVDMAGFAVHVSLLAHATMPYKPGQEEHGFLESLHLKLEDVELRANNCTEIYVWHTQTKNHDPCAVRVPHEYMDNRTNVGMLFRKLSLLGITRTSETDGKPLVISRDGRAKPISSFFN